MRSVLATLLAGAAAFVTEQGVISASESSVKVNVADIIPSVEKLILNEEHPPVAKYQMMRNLQAYDESLFHSVIMSNPSKYLPLIYTPTVGAACLAFSEITPINSGGIYITPEDLSSIPTLLQQWPNPHLVKMVVVTDGSRILGLGDLGGDGMGIPIGKSSLYTSAGGFAPWEVVPITLDLGSNVRGEDRTKYPSYLGTPALRAQDEDRVMEYVRALVDGIKAVYPAAVVQWEDFYLDRAFSILETFRNEVASFNDDIQGTAAVVLGGLISASRAEAIGDAVAAGRPDIAKRMLASKHIGRLSDHTYLFVGAGSASLGVADLLVRGMVELEGVDETLARQQVFMMDSAGLLTHKRERKIDGMKAVFAKNDALPSTSIEEVIRQLRPSVLIGLAAQGPIFDKDVLSAMGEVNKRPIIFALSNPTSKAECTAQDVYDATQGRGIFAAGSPFAAPQARPGFAPPPQAVSQCNNMFIFPGVGLGVSVGGLRTIDDKLFIAAAVALAEQVSYADLAQGMLFPPLADLRKTSAAVAEAVVKMGVQDGIATIASKLDSPAYLHDRMQTLMQEAVWTPSNQVDLRVAPGVTSHSHAIAGLIDFLTIDRSYKANPEPLQRPLPMDVYAFAPWGIRYGSKDAANARVLLAVSPNAAALGFTGFLSKFVGYLVKSASNWVIFPILGITLTLVLKRVKA